MAELLARLSCPGRLFLCFIPELYPRMELSIVKVHYNGNAYSIEVHTDTVTLIIGFVAPFWLSPFSPVAVLTRLFCRRFCVAVLTCRRYDLSPFWPWTPHQKYYFTVDKAKLWLILTEFTARIDLATWINGKRCAFLIDQCEGHTMSTPTTATDAANNQSYSCQFCKYQSKCLKLTITEHKIPPQSINTNPRSILHKVLLLTMHTNASTAPNN